jgi:hydroxyacylglutathione hydrolase
MILKRFYDTNLAQASYLVGCPGAGEALVIDPNRDIDQYIEAAAQEGLRIAGVTETHIHADFVSGSLELSERTGATLFLSDEGDADWKYAFAAHPNVKLIRNGDTIRVGALRFDIIHTPGHTPEHIFFVLTDEAATTEPCCAFTGDLLFAGDVGRPDLLETAAGFKGTMESGAKDLYRSLQKLNRYPSHLLVWPGHGAGSACGKSLGGVPVTTLGYECATNWALNADTEKSFVNVVLDGQPDPPRYFKEMKRVNKAGPAAVDFGAPSRLGGNRLLAALNAGEVIIDIRTSEEVAAGYGPGTLHIPLGTSFTTWSGWLLPYDRPIYLLAASAQDAEQARRELAMIGLDDVRGWFGADALRALEDSNRLERVRQITAEELLNRDDVAVLDVRSRMELEEGSVRGSTHIPLGELQDRLAEVPRGKAIVVHCAGGVRSPMAVSLLRKSGVTELLNLVGGFSDYELAARKRG